MKTGRNSPCTCGSGKKYKQCCGLTEGKSSPWVIIVALLIGGVMVAGALLVSREKAPPPVTTSAPVVPSTAGTPQADAVPGAPQPPGPVPAGKVWSTEHGHWHDAPAK